MRSKMSGQSLRQLKPQPLADEWVDSHTCRASKNKYTSRATNCYLALMTTRGTVGAAHAAIGGAAPYTFQGSVAVHVFSCGSFKASVTVCCGAAVDAAFFIVVVYMEAVGAAWTTRPIRGRTAKGTFGF